MGYIPPPPNTLFGPNREENFRKWLRDRHRDRMIQAAILSVGVLGLGFVLVCIGLNKLAGAN